MAKILKIASHLPEDKITNEELSNRFKNWSSDKIFLKTGIKKRSKSKENETSADLAILAAKKVFDNFEISKEEIDMLMVLLSTMIENETENMLRNNIRFNIVGKIEDLPDKTREWVLSTIEKTKNNTGLILTLALSYGGRQEIVDAFNSLIKSDVKIINEEILKNHLYCPELPDPDMIIRTGGEYRLSNFLLWQSAYAEIYVCNKNWPDFDVAELEKALKEYDNRNRTFGKV